MENQFEMAVRSFWKKVQEDYIEYVKPGGILENRDYYVFQTEYRFQPDLMIVGLNPGGDGLNHGGWLTQGCNSYVAVDHPWFDTIRKIFEYPNDEALKKILENCVGTNMFYVNTGCSKKLPKELTRMGTSQMRELVSLIKPKRIITLHKDVFNGLKNAPEQAKEFGTTILKVSSRDASIPIAYVPNPSRINQRYFTESKAKEWHEALRWFLLGSEG